MVVSGQKRKRDLEDDDIRDQKKYQKLLGDEEIDVDPTDLSGYRVADLVSTETLPPIWYPELMFLLSYVGQNNHEVHYIQSLGAYGDVFLDHVYGLHRLLRAGKPYKCISCYINFLLKLTDYLYVKAVVNCITFGTSAVHLATRIYDMTYHIVDISGKRRLIDDRLAIAQFLIAFGGRIDLIDATGLTMKRWADLEETGDGSIKYLQVK